MNISTICLYPRGFDYPIFRSRLPQLSQYAEPVFCFTDHGKLNLTKWIQANVNGTFYDVNQFETRGCRGDWRSKATNLIIDSTDSEWLLSIEQDFLIRDYPNFFEKVMDAMSRFDVITFAEGNRFHPAFLLIKRDVLDRTDRDFSPVPDKFDHWGSVTKKLKSFAKTALLPDLGLRPGEDWYHFGGLTENYFAPKPYYRLPEFYAYNSACYNCSPISQEWFVEMDRILEGDTGELTDIEEFL